MIFRCFTTEPLAPFNPDYIIVLLCSPPSLVTPPHPRSCFSAFPEELKHYVETSPSIIDGIANFWLENS